LIIKTDLLFEVNQNYKHFEPHNLRGY
jgi:hypothetical protein